MVPSLPRWADCRKCTQSGWMKTALLVRYHQNWEIWNLLSIYTLTTICLARRCPQALGNYLIWVSCTIAANWLLSYEGYFDFLFQTFCNYILKTTHINHALSLHAQSHWDYTKTAWLVLCQHQCAIWLLGHWRNWVQTATIRIQSSLAHAANAVAGGAMRPGMEDNACSFWTCIALRQNCWKFLPHADKLSSKSEIGEKHSLKTIWI